MVREYDSMVIFDKPISIGKIKIYGYVYNADLVDILCFKKDIFKNFAEYVIGTQFWVKIGGKISREKNSWIINNTYHNLDDDFVDKFCKYVYKNHPVKYKKYEKCFPHYFLKDLDEQYIINENYKLWIK